MRAMSELTIRLKQKINLAFELLKTQNTLARTRARVCVKHSLLVCITNFGTSGIYVVMMYYLIFQSWVKFKNNKC